MSNSIKQIAAAVSARKPLPSMETESIEEGYRLQQQLTQEIIGEDIADLKAGLTSVAAQNQLKLNSPLIASLYPRGRLTSGCLLSLVKGQELECEIGVLVDGAGDPIGMLPVIEVVHLVFSRKEDFSVANAVAANLGADRYICGETLPWDEALTRIQMTVCKDGEEIAAMSNDYSFGAPVQGAAWIVSEARKHGLWKEGASNRVLSLGTCGRPLPGESGNYEVDFGALGSISFKVA